MYRIYAPRSLLGILFGIVIGLSFTFVVEQDILAVVLGSLAAAAIAGLDEVRVAVIVASLTGAGLGLFLVARGERFFDAGWAPSGPLSLLIHLVLGVMVSGLVGALYTFVTAKLKTLFDEGRGPHF